MEALADSIDRQELHQEVNRSARYPAAAGACIDRQGGAFENGCSLWYTSKSYMLCVRVVL